jgi:hypothetical protein
MREQWYLCRVPWNGFVILLNEKDYQYQRMHEKKLHVPKPKNDVVLLAQGSYKEMMLFKELAGDLTNVS